MFHAYLLIRILVQGDIAGPLRPRDSESRYCATAQHSVERIAPTSVVDNLLLRATCPVCTHHAGFDSSNTKFVAEWAGA